MLVHMTLLFAGLAPRVQIGLNGEEFLDVPPETNTLSTIAEELQRITGVDVIFDVDSEIGEKETVLAVRMQRHEFVLTASDDNTVKIFNPKTGGKRTLEGHTGLVRSAVFSADGALVLTASADNTTKIFNLETGEVLQTVEGHTKHLNSAAFGTKHFYKLVKKVTL